MYTVHLTQRVPNFNKTKEDGFFNKVAIDEKAIRIIADKYKRLKQGRVKFYHNSKMVADIESQYIIAIIDEG